MSAEVAILNKRGIALAADSAATSTTGTQQKIFSSDNKIFNLSKRHNVGIMTFGESNFMGVPWETVIKMYGSKLTEKEPFPSIHEYAEDFRAFLTKESSISKFQQIFVITAISNCFVEFVLSLSTAVEEHRLKPGAANTHPYLFQLMKDKYEELSDGELIKGLPPDYSVELKEKYGQIIEERKEMFGAHLQDDKISTILTDIAIERLARFSPDNMENTGIVIAGFGADDVFPCLTSFYVGGIVDNILRFMPHKDEAVNVTTYSGIIPFAQDDMVIRFMSGVDPLYEDERRIFISRSLDKILDVFLENLKGLTSAETEGLQGKLVELRNSEFRKLEEDLAELKRSNFSQPILSVVDMLAIDQMALLAESLVSLTALKRMMSTDAETVRGPIDVAVITKGDGFKWIRRKQYFPPELN